MQTPIFVLMSFFVVVSVAAESVSSKLEQEEFLSLVEKVSPVAHAGAEAYRQASASAPFPRSSYAASLPRGTPF